MTKSVARSSDTQSELPLLYTKPVLLRFEKHRRKALRPAKGSGFSAAANAVPLLTTECVQAVRNYPIVFADTALAPALAVLGLKEGQNLSTAIDGFWRAGTYVPAYPRRYPFFVTDRHDKVGHLLAIDPAADRLVDLGVLSGRDLLPDRHRRGWLAAIHLHLASMQNRERLHLLNAEINNTIEQGAA